MEKNALRDDLAEQAVICWLLNGKADMDIAMDALTEDDFGRQDTRAAFLAMKEMYIEGQSRFDEITVSQRLREMGLYDKSGGTAQLYRMQTAVPSLDPCPDIAEHIAILKDKAARRAVFAAGRKLQDAAKSDESPLMDSIGEVEREIFRIGQHGQSEKADIASIMQASLSGLMDAYEGKSPEGSIRTGFHDLDRMLGCIGPTDFVVIGARPSMGKTAMALNIMENVAMKQEKATAFFSLEMSKEQLGTRMICSYSGVPAEKIRNGEIGSEEISALGNAAKEISSAPIELRDNAPMTAAALVASARQMKAEKNIGLIIVDYLQLMAGDRRDSSRQQEVSDISCSLKNLAKEIKVPVIALSQLNRGVESREDKRPRMSDIRESGSLEQDADIIIFLYRDEYYYSDSDDKGVAEVIISKHRNGSTGTVRLMFSKEITRFCDLAAEYQTASLPPSES